MCSTKTRLEFITVCLLWLRYEDFYLLHQVIFTLLFCFFLSWGVVTGFAPRWWILQMTGIEPSKSLWISWIFTQNSKHVEGSVQMRSCLKFLTYMENASCNGKFNGISHNSYCQKWGWYHYAIGLIFFIKEWETVLSGWGEWMELNPVRPDRKIIVWKAVAAIYLPVAPIF